MDTARNEKRLRKCAHLPCQCMVPEPLEYCNPYCSAADDVEETEIGCECGHRHCALN